MNTFILNIRKCLLLLNSFIQLNKKVCMYISIFLFSTNVYAQDYTITTADVLANVAEGSTTATISKNGTDLVITKTGGSTSPVHVTYPTGPPINTIPEDMVNNIEGLHLGRTWGAFGTGWLDSYGQLRSENYTFAFSEKLQQFEMILGAMNDNADGIERLRIVDIKNEGVSVLSDVTFSIRVDYDDINSDSLIFDEGTRTIRGQDYPKATGWNESSLFTIESSVPFDEITLERYDVENNRTDVNVNGRNYSNGISLTYMGVYYASSTLPVELVDFNAKLNSTNEIDLTWATLSEVNNDKFEILWKKDNSTWQTIGQSKGVGNSAILNNYKFTHTSPGNGVNYYQLIQYDFDGKSTASKVISIKNNVINDEILLYPNPNNGSFSIKSTTNNINKIEVVDMTGIVLKYLLFNQVSDVTVDLNDCNLGVYIVKVFTGDSVKINKILVE